MTHACAQLPSSVEGRWSGGPQRVQTQNKRQLQGQGLRLPGASEQVEPAWPDEAARKGLEVGGG